MCNNIERLRKDVKDVEIAIEKLLIDLQKKHCINISGIDVYSDTLVYDEKITPSYVSEVSIKISL